MKVGKIFEPFVLSAVLAATSAAVPTGVQAEENGSTIGRYVERMDPRLQGYIVGAGSVGIVVISNMARKQMQEIYRQFEEDAIKQKETEKETYYNCRL